MSRSGQCGRVWKDFCNMRDLLLNSQDYVSQNSDMVISLISKLRSPTTKNVSTRQVAIQSEDMLLFAGLNKQHFLSQQIIFFFTKI